MLEGKHEYWLEYKWRHKLVKELSWLMHLVAPSYNGCEQLEYLLCYKIVFCVLLQRINAMLQYFLSECLVVFRVKGLDILNCA